MKNTTYLSTKKLIAQLPSYFESENLKNAEYTIIYFDQVRESQFGGSVNILKAVIADKRFNIL